MPDKDKIDYWVDVIKEATNETVAVGTITEEQDKDRDEKTKTS